MHIRSTLAIAARPYFQTDPVARPARHVGSRVAALVAVAALGFFVNRELQRVETESEAMRVALFSAPLPMPSESEALATTGSDEAELAEQAVAEEVIAEPAVAEPTGLSTAR